MTRLIIQIVAVTVLAAVIGCSRRASVTIGSKAFAESAILGEIATELARGSGAEARHLAELGGTRLVWNALVAGQIDVYPEYTGTIVNEIFASRHVHGEKEIRAALAANDVAMSEPLGFSDNYAIGMRDDVAQRLGVHTISDLRRHPEMRFGFSSEFLDRADGWPALRETYQLPQQNVRGLQHDLAYRALADGAIDVTDLYSTDAEIAQYGLRLLEDDLHHFPEYQAVLLYRADAAARVPHAIAAIKRMQGQISRQHMIEMNEQVKLKRSTPEQVGRQFLREVLHVSGPASATHGLWQRLKARTVEHLELFGISLVAAVLIGILLGVLAVKFPLVGQGIMAVVAAIYTIPALALLVFMLPLFGIGWRPAVVALFLYSLLPIVRNTHSGLRGIPEATRESGEVLGLPPIARLLRIELPLASPVILAGIQTAAVLDVGTATLGGFIGAGGYGQSIFTGITLGNFQLILEGAIPAALLALAVQGAFEILGRFAIPRGLRLKPR